MLEEAEAFGVISIARDWWKLSSVFEDLYFVLKYQISSVSPGNTKEFGEDGQGCSLSSHCCAIYVCLFIGVFRIMAKVSILWLNYILCSLCKNKSPCM